MKILITNDDGIDAPGLNALWSVARDLGDCMIVAPADPASGCGHAVTTHQPIRFEERRPGWFAVSGTPADCVRLALFHLHEPIDAVLSGINSGGNLGCDVYHSGTVAAAREAALHGRPAIALSHYIARGRAIDWSQAQAWASRVLINLLALEHEPESYWNVNFPHPESPDAQPEVVLCPLDPSPLAVAFQIDCGTATYSGSYPQRPRKPGHDVDVCFSGRIALTRLKLS
jgi:5'-nucleotidase